MKGKVYDVTLPISAQLPVWPGDPAPEVARVRSVDAGDSFNLSSLKLSSHTGTHVDAPHHFIGDGATMDRLPLEVLIGAAWVCLLSNEVRLITADVLARASVPAGTRRLLLATSNSSLWDRSPWSFCEEYVALSPDAARWIVDRGIALLGIDYLSVDPAGSADYPAHRILLSAGVVVVEGLDMRGVPAGGYHLICLPMKVAGGDGAPARVLLVRED